MRIVQLILVPREGIKLKVYNNILDFEFEMTGVYNIENKFEQAFNNLDSKIKNKHNRLLVKEFLSYLSANDVGVSRQLKYLFGLQNINSWLNKDFESATKKNIQEIISQMKNGKKKNGSPKYTNWTQHDHRIYLKKFYTWLKNKDIDDEDDWVIPKEVKWIKASRPRGNNKLPSDLLTSKDIELLVDNCRNLREKALILTLFESGARIGEILTLKIMDVEFDDYGAMLNINGKTGYRKIRIVGSSPAISKWLNDEHPKRDDKNSYVFCNINQSKGGSILSYASAKKILNNLKKRTGFNKPLNPHHFRHSRATVLAESLSDSQRCHYLGWQQGSQMARIYTHIEDTNRVILELNGLVKKDKDKKGFQYSICPRCNIKNPFGSKFCSQCSMGLDLKSIEGFEKVKSSTMTHIQDDSTVESIVEMVLKKLEENKK